MAVVPGKNRAVINRINYISTPLHPPGNVVGVLRRPDTPLKRAAQGDLTHVFIASPENDFDTSGLMVSVIRQGGDSKKPVRPGNPFPPAYQDMPTDVYNKLVVGPRAWNACAVVAHKTDFPVMLRHAVLREMKQG